MACAMHGLHAWAACRHGACSWRGGSLAFGSAHSVLVLCFRFAPCLSSGLQFWSMLQFWPWPLLLVPFFSFGPFGAFAVRAGSGGVGDPAVASSAWSRQVQVVHSASLENRRLSYPESSGLAHT